MKKMRFLIELFFFYISLFFLAQKVDGLDKTKEHQDFF